MPRATELTDEIHRRMCALLRAGNLVETALTVCGVEPLTHQQWLEQAETEGADGPHRRYAEDVEQALAEAESIAVAVIAKHARTDWRAAAWYLERAHAGRWGKPAPGADRPASTSRNGLPSLAGD